VFPTYLLSIEYRLLHKLPVKYCLSSKRTLILAEFRDWQEWMG
jgi:hypothetical protein